MRSNIIFNLNDVRKSEKSKDDFIQSNDKVHKSEGSERTPLSIKLQLGQLLPDLNPSSTALLSSEESPAW